MNLAIDIGNTAVKWACFEGGEEMEQGQWGGRGAVPKELTEAMERAERTLGCASGDMACLGREIPTLSAKSPIPLRLDYRTPETLGADRIAAACGAWALHPGEACVVVDAGTCITVDFVDGAGVYHGGAIMPGLKMKLKALHTFTDKLPLIEIDGLQRAPVLGRSTEECIVAGTLGATMLAVAGYVALYRAKTTGLHVLLTGGDAPRLTTGGADGWEQVPHLTLAGLDVAMRYAAEKGA